MWDLSDKDKTDLIASLTKGYNRVGNTTKALSGVDVQTNPVTLETATHLARNHEKWRVYLVNTTSRSAFWEATGDGQFDVHIRYGALGTHGRDTACSYAVAVRRISEKLAKDYRYTKLTVPEKPAASLPPKERGKTIRELMGATTMRPTTAIQLMDMTAKFSLNRISAGEDYRDIYKNASGVSVLQANNGQLWVIAKYGDELLYGLLK